jgi:hypothetical protein
MQAAQLQAAGLVATQAIRAGSNRVVLERLLQDPISEHNHAHGNSNLRHTATGGTTAHGGHPAGTGRSGRAGDRQEQDNLVTQVGLEVALAPLRTDLAVLKWMIGLLLAGVMSLVIKAFF